MTSPAPSKSYKDTLNLPTTKFDMKANLTQREPLFQERWRKMGLYAKIREARSGSTKRVLHDGPPYANGEIHMGHLLNKALKDFVVRSQTMLGHDSPYTPGWDCHGLPIEHKVVKDLGSRAAALGRSEIRKLCRTEALKWVDLQRDQFRRLGIEGDWDRPYLTLDPRYEAGILDVMADLIERGLVFRMKKPIHWCTADRTALAEAELEYRDETSPSVYVNFPMVSDLSATWGAGLGPWHAMIWTTTPWTLPANVAIAVHRDLEYAGLVYVDPATERETCAIVAAKLVEKIVSLVGAVHWRVVGTIKGSELEHARYRHVFIDREGPIVLADYVSVEDGTGLVHTAPGHGGEDYLTGKAYGLPVLSPVDTAGRFDSSAPAWLVGKQVFAANAEIIAKLKDASALVHSYSFTHSYPHCWRCKKPVIFRATEQWFIGIDRGGLRNRAMAAISQVRWRPEWGRSRIEAMVSNRPDWCISRQRAWGVPIPAFRCAACGEVMLTAAIARAIRDRFRAEGSDVWFDRPAGELAPPGTECPKCGGKELEKEEDILDVWFESGSSHRAVLSEPSFGLTEPAYLYLEGSDQHRGWFQSSLLTSVGSRDRAPFETVLTHGFIVDDQGKKLSKSEGNAISAVKSTETHGADVLRLYVASLDYSDDVRVGERGIKEMSEIYRKIRNTIRYLLGNLEDYRDFNPDAVDLENLHEIDRWALGRLNALVRETVASYEVFEFYRVYQRIYQFCVVDLSSFYLDVLKDRLYAEAKTGPDRSAARYVLARLHDALARLLAPLVPHTAEEIWDFMPTAPGKPLSVHLARFPGPDPRFDDEDLDRRWETLFRVRDEILRELEKLRSAKTIGGGQEACVTVASGSSELAAFLVANRAHLEAAAIVSDLKVVSPEELAGGAAGLQLPELLIKVERSSHGKCERCWNYRPEVGADAEHPELCGRCLGVLRQGT